MTYRNKTRCAAFLLLGAAMTTPALANEQALIVANTDLQVTDVDAKVGNMRCQGFGENASFQVLRGQEVSCSFSHTGDVTAVYFIITTKSSDQRCAILVTRDFLHYADGVHYDPDDKFLPGFNCQEVQISGDTITVD